MLLKESYTLIGNLLDTGKLPRKNNSQKIVRFKLQMIGMRFFSYDVACRAAFGCGV